MSETNFFDLKTDLADENNEILKKRSDTIHGISTQNRTENGIDIFTMDIKSRDAEIYSGKKRGRYVTVNVGNTHLYDSGAFEKVCETFTGVVKSFTDSFDGKGAFLIAGLGNPGLPADSVGAQTVKNFIVTRHIKASSPELFERFAFTESAAVVPDVFGNTGIEAAEVIKGVADDIKPCCIIAIDALTSRHISRLATTVQICNTGICPGSGVGNVRKEISAETFGIPVIAIGVPTVVNATTLISDILSDCGINKNSLPQESHGKLLSRVSSDCYVCPKESGESIRSISRLIGYSLNAAIHKGISYSEMADFL